MLRQQHLQLVNADLTVHLSDARVVNTLCWYARAVAGKNRVAADLTPTPGGNARDLSAGDIGMLITPDWMVDQDLKSFAPELKGKLKMISLPVFSGSDAHTASWGGTMIGITRGCADPDAAWKLVEALYLDRSALRARQAFTGILPPIRDYWTDPVYHQPDPFFAGEKIDELYIALAGELPKTEMTAYTIAAQTYLTLAMNRTVQRVKSGGDDGLEADCRGWLQAAQSRVESLIRFDGSGAQR